MKLAAILFATVVIVAGCATPPPEPPSGPFYWPTPPDQPRFLYEGALRDSNSLRGATETSQLKLALTGADRPERLSKPLAVAAHGGRIYVSDTEARRVTVFDVARRKTYHFGLRPEGQLRKPAGISVDEAGYVYVADISSRRVMVYDALGLFIRELGQDSKLERPTSVAVNRSGSRAYVVDAGGVESDNHRVVCFDGEGKELFTLGPRGKDPGKFNLPVDAAVAPDGTLYVLDSGNFRVQAFDPDGRFLRAFGNVGNNPGQFARPRGIAVDSDANVYVSDAHFNNIQVFNPQGELLLALGSSSAKDGPGNYRLIAGLSVDETKRLFVVDQYFKKVEVIRRLSDEEGIEILQGAK